MGGITTPEARIRERTLHTSVWKAAHSLPRLGLSDIRDTMLGFSKAIAPSQRRL
ncbi:hypothetical protein CHELA1G2_11562 [Hyphomicrobiales bacterium]|nr:hypothetical protein CHELA1G2_11562 [Hyphomicrobiales bacterium]